MDSICYIFQIRKWNFFSSIFSLIIKSLVYTSYLQEFFLREEGMGLGLCWQFQKWVELIRKATKKEVLEQKKTKQNRSVWAVIQWQSSILPGWECTKEVSMMICIADPALIHLLAWWVKDAMLRSSELTNAFGSRGRFIPLQWCWRLLCQILSAWLLYKSYKNICS